MTTISSSQATPLTPVISRYWDDPESWTMATYQRHDGYRAMKQALAMEPDAVIAAVKDSGLRGRGGAGFSTGTKWSFIPQGDTGPAAKPHYLVVNADESEPGTCKDIPLMLATPHVLIEGVIIASYAIRANHAFIYVRGEVLPVLRRLQNAAFGPEKRQADRRLQPPVRRAQFRERPLVPCCLLVVLPQEPHEAAHEQQIHGERDDADSHVEELGAVDASGLRAGPDERGPRGPSQLPAQTRKRP